MGRIKKVKTKLLKAAEARAKVEEQRKWIEHLNLVINRAQNDVASLEGARVNLKMMYESSVSEMITARKKAEELMGNVRELQAHNHEIVAFADRRSTELSEYKAETAGQVVGRGICMFIGPITQAVKRLFTRKRNR